MRGPIPQPGLPPRRRSARRAAGLALCALVAVLLAVAGCRSERPPPPPGGVERGIASWYGGKFQGRPTASGEIFDTHQLTAAHRSLPFQTRVEVVNLDNGRRVVVRINDRGPFVRGRIVDLSYAAARQLGMVGPGTARVELHVLGRGDAGALQDPERADATATAGRYTVQVGAFQDPVRADALRAELARRYPGVEVTSDGVWHRVQVGTYERRPAAERIQRELRRLGFTALVVPLG